MTTDKQKLENLIRRFHGNSCYPVAEQHEVDSVVNSILAIQSSQSEQCEDCHDTGRIFIGNSGLESDGNAPEYEDCGCRDQLPAGTKLYTEQPDQTATIQALKSALNAMLTQFGMDEDEWNKATFDQARKALNDK